MATPTCSVLKFVAVTLKSDSADEHKPWRRMKCSSKRVSQSLVNRMIQLGARAFPEYLLLAESAARPITVN